MSHIWLKALGRIRSLLRACFRVLSARSVLSESLTALDPLSRPLRKGACGARGVPQSTGMLTYRRVHRGFQYAQAACATSCPEAPPVSLENMVRAHRTLDGPLRGYDRWLLAGRKYGSRVGYARARSGIAPRTRGTAAVDRQEDGILRTRDQVAPFNDGTVHCNSTHHAAYFRLDAALDRQEASF
jgi:hypothetical protein